LCFSYFIETSFDEAVEIALNNEFGERCINYLKKNNNIMKYYFVSLPLFYANTFFIHVKNHEEIEAIEAEIKIVVIIRINCFN